jgi:hypothetical protein
MAEIPNTIAECDGCGKELNLLSPYLSMSLKAQRQVLVVEEVESENPDEIAEPNIYLGSKKGRGVIRIFHDFDCAIKWMNKRKGLKAKLEVHKEDEIYVPEDNRSPEELVEAGEMTRAAFRAIDMTPAEGGE